MNTLTLIAAASENNALGKDNDLLWHLPDDFKRFKALTTGHSIIMGRKTFESFPKPLPNRKHIIITRDTNYHTAFDNCIVVHSLEEAFTIVENEAKSFIIGGGEIYHLALPYCTNIELTRVHDTFDADAFFPEIPETDWKLLATEKHLADERHAHAFTYETYLRI